MDNTYSECLLHIKLRDIELIKAKAGLLGGAFKFKADGKTYNYQLGAKAKKFVDTVKAGVL